ncbi:MAG: hypothetical protein JSR26_05205 [Proteobacteria bacterium]|nr:hypothetical protein [Pseudomonadota bacterium]
MTTIDVHPMLRSKRPLIFTRPAERLGGDAKNAIEFGADSIWVNACGRFGKTYAVRQLTQTFSWRPFPMFMAEFTYTKPNKPTEGYFAGSLLLQADQVVSTSAMSNGSLMRAIRMLQEQGHRQGAEVIAVAFNEANRFTVEEYEHVMSMANECEKTGRIFFFFINQSDAGRLGRSGIDKRPPRHLFGRFFTTSHQFTGLLWDVPEHEKQFQLVSDVALAFREYDEELCTGDGVRVTFTQFFAPKAYAAGWRLGTQIDLIRKVINEVRSENGLGPVSEWPMQTFERFVYFVLVRLAFDNPDFEELTPATIREGLLRSGYLEIEPGYRGGMA